MFDWDVASAAHAAAEQAAAKAARQPSRREEPPPAPSSDLNKAMQVQPAPPPFLSLPDHCHLYPYVEVDDFRSHYDALS